MRSKKGGVLIIIPIVITFVALLTAGYFYLQSQKLSQPVIAPVIPTPAPIATDETAGWKEFTDEHLSFKYPQDWTVEKMQVFGSRSEVEFKYKNTTVLALRYIANYNQSTGKPYATLEEYLGGNTSAAKDIVVGNYSGKIVNNKGLNGHTIPFLEAVIFSTDKKLLIDFYYEGSNYPKQNIENTFDQVLTTVKFLGQKEAQNYPVPSSWSKYKVVVLGSLNLCLPTNWEINPGGYIYFHRDSAYQPLVTSIQEIPYSGGSRRQAYFDFWKREYPNPETLVNVEDVTINGNSAILITPKTSQAKESPEGMAVVWYAGGKLWKAGLSNWAMINNSQEAFLKDFYTSISCSF